MRVPHGLTLSDGANPDEIQHLQGRRFARALATAGRLAFSPWKEAWASHATVRALVCDCFLLAGRQADISEPAQSGQACHGEATDIEESRNGAGFSSQTAVVHAERRPGTVSSLRFLVLKNGIPSEETFLRTLLTATPSSNTLRPPVLESQG